MQLQVLFYQLMQDFPLILAYKGGHMHILEKQLAQFGVIPVVVIEDAKDARLLADALVKGGLPCAEVTFRTEAAKEAIYIMTKTYPDMLVGAGTVLTIEQVDRAVSAGAKFIVSPGFDTEIVDYCIQKKIPVLPGCVMPSELSQAVKKGLRIVKFFPAEQFGGVDTIRSLAAPYATVRFMPTGGVNIQNLKEYLIFEKIICCGGSWMVKSELIEAGEFERISLLAEQAVNMVKSIKCEGN